MWRFQVRGRDWKLLHGKRSHHEHWKGNKDSIALHRGTSTDSSPIIGTSGVSGNIRAVVRLRCRRAPVATKRVLAILPWLILQ